MSCIVKRVRPRFWCTLCILHSQDFVNHSIKIIFEDHPTSDGPVARFVGPARPVIKRTDHSLRRPLSVQDHHIDVQDQNHQSLRYSHVAASRCQVAPAEARMQGPPHQASCVKFVHFIVKSFPCFVESCTYLRPGGLHQLAVNNRREIPGQAHVVPSHSNLRIRRTEDEPIEVIKFRSLE